MLVSFDSSIIKSNKRFLINLKYLAGLETRSSKSETSKVFDIKKTK